MEIQVSTPRATFWLKLEDGKRRWAKIVDAAPIARRYVGLTYVAFLNQLIKRGVSVIEGRPLLIEEDRARMPHIQRSLF